MLDVWAAVPVKAFNGAKQRTGLVVTPAQRELLAATMLEDVLDALAGAQPQPLPFAQAALRKPFSSKTGLTRFLPASLSGSHDLTEVELLRWQGSGDLMAAARANCYIVVPPGKEQFAAGEMITVLLS